MIAKRDKANVLRPSVEHWRRKGRLALFAVDIDDQLESPALGSVVARTKSRPRGSPIMHGWKSHPCTIDDLI